MSRIIHSERDERMKISKSMVVEQTPLPHGVLAGRDVPNGSFGSGFTFGVIGIKFVDKELPDW